MLIFYLPFFTRGFRFLSSHWTALFNAVVFKRIWLRILIVANKYSWPNWDQRKSPDNREIRIIEVRIIEVRLYYHFIMFVLFLWSLKNRFEISWDHSGLYNGFLHLSRQHCAWHCVTWQKLTLRWPGTERSRMTTLVERFGTLFAVLVFKLNILRLKGIKERIKD